MQVKNCSRKIDYDVFDLVANKAPLLYYIEFSTSLLPGGNAMFGYSPKFGYSIPLIIQ